MTTRGTSGADVLATNRRKDLVYLNLNAALLAFTLWLLAVVLARPWGQSAIAGNLLIGKAVGVIALGIWDAGSRPGLPARLRRRAR